MIKPVLLTHGCIIRRDGGSDRPMLCAERRGLHCTHLLLCSVLFLSLSGCSVLKNAHHTISGEIHYKASNRAVEKRIKKWAEEGWIAYTASCPEVEYNKHFKRGFKAGYIRHLRTGKLDDAAAPPYEYTKAKYVDWETRHLVQQWIQGHSMGTLAAVESGYRELIIVPVAGAGNPSVEPVPAENWEDQPPVIYSDPNEVYGDPVTNSGVVPTSWLSDQPKSAPFSLPDNLESVRSLQSKRLVRLPSIGNQK